VITWEKVKFNRGKLMDISGALFWAGLLGLRLRVAIGGDYVSLLLAAQSGLVLVLLMTRNAAGKDASMGWRVLAWGSALLPLTLMGGGVRLIPTWTSGLAASLGLAFSLWALWTLRRSFGIAPADRGLIKGGPYRIMRHPAYAGELVSVCAFVLGSFFTVNIVIVVVLIVTLILRMLQEERMIQGYPDYAGDVRWRLLPGLW
jgi:protein-S-isoprenylcysteine O-methyltransferase Ste14